MKITEIFYSLQGEGFLAGRPSVFVRVAGCPLRCRWCDTKYAWAKEGALDLSIDEIVQSVGKYDCGAVVVTGGEPMVNPELAELLNKLKEAGCHITIETAGIKFVAGLRCDLMSISPKLSNSVPEDSDAAKTHSENYLDVEALRELVGNYDYQLKFVVDGPVDIEEIQQLIGRLDGVDKAKVMLMPQAATREQYLKKSHIVADICKNTGFAFSQRLHIMLYDDQKGV